MKKLYIISTTVLDGSDGQLIMERGTEILIPSFSSVSKITVNELTMNQFKAELMNMNLLILFCMK